ncbi:AAA domain-containing protein [Actinoplanes sp. NPDC049681]|uniref:AAA domain-containing protein n=1 Tax=Actinoplanes sp. NPDC049681 TaxID=3363905 RepID=UPI0037944D14
MDPSDQRALPQRPTLRVSEIGEYVRHRSCERRFKLEINRRHEARRLPFYERLFNTLDVVLQLEGHRREDEWAESLAEAGLVDLVGGRPADDDDPNPAWSDFVEAVTRLDPGVEGYAREVRLEGRVGAFQVEGRADFLLLLWRNDRPVVRIVECKASRRDRTYQRLQVALYARLVKRCLSESSVSVGGCALSPQDVEVVVARVDESTNTNQSILELEPFDVDMEDSDLLHLLAEGGTLAYVDDTPLHDLSYQIDQKCDGCVFNVHCLPESARLRRHELLGMSVSAARALRSAGVETIDDLAELDAASDVANALRADPAFPESLDRLINTARARRVTLPANHSGEASDNYPVQALPDSPSSQLPEHESNGERLIRIYLGVDYDYTENRIGALTAHLTASRGEIHTGWRETTRRRDDGSTVSEPDPVIRELVTVGLDGNGAAVKEMQPLRGRDIVQVQASEWTGRYEEDTGAERGLIQNFLFSLIEAIAEIAGDPEEGGAGDGLARLHFYVWSRSEMAQLVEACSRASSRLLGALRELMGSREGLEQLIYSCLQDEVDRRYALAWTGRGLGVVTSLTWFGQRYHWTRRIAGTDVPLDRVFTQDIFDFKTSLDLAPDGNWARANAPGSMKHRFEIRSRFHDTLPAPYWRAVWQSLPSPNAAGIAPQLAQAIRRYEQASLPGRLYAYLKARAHALRWVEERIRFKNREIEKPRLVIDELQRFTLGVDDARAAAVDFLRLDHAVKLTDWVSTHLQSIRVRVPTGRTLPVREVIQLPDRSLRASIDVEAFGLTPEEFRARTSIGVDSFVRLTPHNGDPSRGQTIGQLLRGGRTCRISDIDWDSGVVALTQMFMRPTRYTLMSSTGSSPGPVFEYATLDESVSDFVAGRVDARLLSGNGLHATEWFDPHNPAVPPQPQLEAAVQQCLDGAVRTARLRGEHSLSQDQADAVMAGLNARVQLLQGPPGTGKTQTTALAILSRAAARYTAGDIVLVAAHTHTAVDTLIRRIYEVRPLAAPTFAAAGCPLPEIRLAKVHSSAPIENLIAPAGIDMPAKPSATTVNRERSSSVLVLAGTTAALLKMAAELGERNPWRTQGGFSARALIVDEASMMVFPHFLALATCVHPDGEVLLAGDHRQLSPILAHDWETEDRPPAVAYQPFASAYNAVKEIADQPSVTSASVTRSALELTFRLPPPIVELISRIYRLDDIQLQGLTRVAADTADQTPTGVAGVAGSDPVAAGLASVWAEGPGLYLVLHDERESRQSNDFEALLIAGILEAAPTEGGPASDSVAVITPHRAQRSLLKSTLEGSPLVSLVDTVERLQGGERPVVVVSGTASEPSAIAASAEFLLDLNRSNVAFSRCKDQLIVVCSRTLLDHVPADIENYQNALLWKSLRALCTRLIGEATIAGHHVQVLTIPVAA